MNPKCYATNPESETDKGFQHSRVIMAAFAEGCKGQIVPPIKLLDGPAAMYGILRGTGEIIRQCEWMGRDYYYIDHGYLKAGHYGGYYRVTKNARQADILDERVSTPPSDRLERLGVNLRPWRRHGNHILVIPVTGAVGNFYGVDENQWLAAAVSEISNHTDRPILTKPKGQGSLQDALKNCWCVVTHSSNVAVDALIEGVPVITLGESVCNTISWNFADIEKPYWPERDWWLRAVCYNQWTLDEMRSGECWEYVK